MFQPGDFARLLWAAVREARYEGLFAEAFELHWDENEAEVRPSIADQEAYFLRALKTAELGHSTRKPEPPTPFFQRDKDLLLDFLELLHAECVSAPSAVGTSAYDDRYFRAPFHRDVGQRRFRDKINPLLELDTPPLEMLASGRVVERPPPTLHALVEDAVPASVEAEIAEPVETAIDQFLRRGASVQDRRSAVKHLADALEPLREEIKQEMLSEDERALFRIANEFGLRHNRREQRRDYDKDVWLEWMFYVYLTTTRAIRRVRDGQAEAGASSAN